MPKSPATKTSKTSPVRSGGKKVKVKQKTAPLSKEIHALVRTTDLIKRRSGKLARASSAIGHAAGHIHQGVEHLHSTAAETHNEIRAIGKRTSRKASGEHKPFLVVGIGASAGG